jgi:hypothetical protein
VIIDLAEVVGQVGGEVQKELPGAEDLPADRLGIVGCECFIAHPWQSLLDGFEGLFDFADQFLPADITPGELGRPVAFVITAPEIGPYIVLKVAGEV